MSNKNRRLSIAKVKALLPLLPLVQGKFPQYIRKELILLKSGKLQSKTYVEDDGKKKPLNSSTFRSLLESELIVQGGIVFNDGKDENLREVEVILYSLTQKGEKELTKAVMINTLNRLANLVPDPMEDETVQHMMAIMD